MWLGTITNIGVILGLLLVAFQINQTNEAIHQESVAMMLDSYVAGDEILGELYIRIAESREWAVSGEEGTPASI